MWGDPLNRAVKVVVPFVVRTVRHFAKPAVVIATAVQPLSEVDPLRNATVPLPSLGCTRAMRVTALVAPTLSVVTDSCTVATSR